MRRNLVLALLVLCATTAWAGAGSAEKKTPLSEVGPRPKPVPPVDQYALEKAIAKGVGFLLKDQNKNGSWGTPQLNKGGVAIYAPVPGAHQAFQAATTALCLSALMEVGGDTPEVRKAIERGEAWLLENLPKLRRAESITLYNIWGHAYGISALVRMHQRLPAKDERRKKIETIIRDQIDLLRRYESVDKGWGYYDFRSQTQRPGTDSTPFMTAAVLVALYEAKGIGISVPDKLVKGAVASIQRQRLPDFSYLYGEYLQYSPGMGINRPGGSLGRSQACNVALRLWGDEKVTDKVMETWLDRLFARNLWLDLGRKKPYPHESYFMVAGYFYYFGHYYAALCIEQLPPKERPFYQDHLATVLMRLQSKDGSWWDFPMYNYHQQYGTAFALMSLKSCRHADGGKQK
jgi:hypothetical protein